MSSQEGKATGQMESLQAPDESPQCISEGEQERSRVRKQELVFTVSLEQNPSGRDFKILLKTVFSLQPAFLAASFPRLWGSQRKDAPGQHPGGAGPQGGAEKGAGERRPAGLLQGAANRGGAGTPRWLLALGDTCNPSTQVPQGLGSVFQTPGAHSSLALGPHDAQTQARRRHSVCEGYFSAPPTRAC